MHPGYESIHHALSQLPHLVSGFAQRPAVMHLRHGIGHLLSVINLLAPLSVVIAALGLLNTLRQNTIKRNQDVAKSTREILTRAGTKAYLLNWSLIGNMNISAGVLQLREMIEARIGKTPTVKDFESFLADRPLVESMIEKAWRDSGVIAQFLQESLEFGQIRADLGDKIALIQEALDIVVTRLRLLFMVDAFSIDSFRNNPRYRSIARSATARQPDAMTNLQGLFLSAVRIPEKDSFSEACTLLEHFADITAAASDKRILKLLRQRPHAILRMRDFFERKRHERLDRVFRKQFSRQVNDRLPLEAELLCKAADEALYRAGNTRRAQQRLERSSLRIHRIFHGVYGSEDMDEASTNFLTAHLASERKTMSTLTALLRLKFLGVTDPDVDFHLAVITGIRELLESADTRGASRSSTTPTLLAKHSNASSADQEDWPGLAVALDF
jgi:hypothetical protein